jgi:hypothetical protein
MDFCGIVMVTERVEMLVGLGQFGNFFAGEGGRLAALPELMFAFDLALGLGRGGVAQADVVEPEGRAPIG